MSASPHSDSTTVALLLAARLEAGALVSPLTDAELFRLGAGLHARKVLPEALLTTEAGSLLAELEDDPEVDLPSDRLRVLLDRGVLLGVKRADWSALGLWVVSRFDRAYPVRLRQRLRAQAPGLLYGRGPIDLFETPALAVIGSREANEEALAFAERLGNQAAAEGMTLVSGGARGIDRAAMGGALDAEGTAIGVLPGDLRRQVLDRELRDRFRTSLILVSAAIPEAGFSVGNAMGRNKIIYALAEAAVAVVSDKSGGTWEGAQENLKKGWVPLYLPAAIDSPGRAPLVRAGGSLFEGPWPPLTALPAPPAEEALAHPKTTRGLWEVVHPILLEVLTNPLSEQAVATTLDIELGQARAWIKRGIDQGELVKLGGKPPMFIATAPFIARVEALLTQARTETELAELTGWPLPAIRSWLKVGAAGGAVTRLAKPVRWIRTDHVPEPSPPASEQLPLIAVPPRPAKRAPSRR